jgi:hypothetical protein
MKKITLIFIGVVIAASFSFTSCRKCTTCTYSYPDGLGGTQTYTYPETCGKSKAIDDYKAACESAASIYGESCSCD